MNREQAEELVGDLVQKCFDWYDYFEASDLDLEKHEALRKKMDAAREEVIQALVKD